MKNVVVNNSIDFVCLPLPWGLAYIQAARGIASTRGTGRFGYFGILKSAHSESTRTYHTSLGRNWFYYNIQNNIELFIRFTHKFYLKVLKCSTFFNKKTGGIPFNFMFHLGVFLVCWFSHVSNNIILQYIKMYNSWKIEYWVGSQRFQHFVQFISSSHVTR